MTKIYGDEKGSKYQWKKLKGEPLSVKFNYIWEYYGVAIIIVIAAIAMAISIISSVIYNSVPNVISGEIYSAELTDEGTEELRLSLCDALGYDETQYHISIAASYPSSDLQTMSELMQKFQAELAAQAIDFFAGPKDSVLYYYPVSDPDSRAYHDLRDILPEELMSKLEADDKILYASTDESGDIPIGVLLNDSKLAGLFGIIESSDYYVSCIINTTHIESYIALVNMIYQ